MLSINQPAALESYFSFIIINATHVPALWFFEINLIGGPGSLVNNPPAAALNSAYSGRGALWVVQHYASSSSTNILPFVNGLNNAMEKEMPGTAFGGYLNYVDPGLSAQEAHALYYSKEVYARLTGIKKVVDPGNVFSNPQGVGIWNVPLRVEMVLLKVDWGSVWIQRFALGCFSGSLMSNHG